MTAVTRVHRQDQATAAGAEAAGRADSTMRASPMRRADGHRATKLAPAAPRRRRGRPTRPSARQRSRAEVRLRTAAESGLAKRLRQIDRVSSLLGRRRVRGLATGAGGRHHRRPEDAGEAGPHALRPQLQSAPRDRQGSAETGSMRRPSTSSARRSTAWARSATSSAGSRRAACASSRTTICAPP